MHIGLALDNLQSLSLVRLSRNTTRYKTKIDIKTNNKTDIDKQPLQTVIVT